MYLKYPCNDVARVWTIKPFAWHAYIIYMYILNNIISYYTYHREGRKQKAPNRRLNSWWDFCHRYTPKTLGGEYPSPSPPICRPHCLHRILTTTSSISVYIYIYVCLYTEYLYTCFIHIYYYISRTVSWQYARAFLSSPSADAGLILPSAAAQHQRGPRARVQYTPRARMGNRVWFLNKYCRKPFSTLTRCSIVSSFSCPRSPESIPPQPHHYLPLIHNQSHHSQPKGIYIMYPERAADLHPPRDVYTYYIYICIVCTQWCYCMCVYYSPSSDASASGYLYVFVRNVCQLCILYFLTKRAPTRIFLTPFFCFLFLRLSTLPLCVYLWYFIHRFALTRHTHTWSVYACIIYMCLSNSLPLLLKTTDAQLIICL